MLKVFHREVIKANRLLCVATACNFLHHLLLIQVVVIEDSAVRLAIVGALHCSTVLLKLLQVYALAWSIPGFINVLHVAVERAELHQELCLVQVPLIIVNICFDSRFFLITTVSKVSCFVQSFAKLIIVPDPPRYLVLRLLLSLRR